MTVEAVGPGSDVTAEATIPLAEPWFDDREPARAADVVASRWLISGPVVEEFERRFATMHGAAHGVAVNSGSSALLVAMAALGVGPGTEIVAPDMTFVSTASAAMFLGATPVFADIEPVHHNLDPARIEERITPRTRAIVPVHYAGHAADMTAILEVAGAHGVPVLEDAAEAHLSRAGDRHVGSIGAAGIFSFTPSKPMTTGEGGMILTNDADIADACRLFRNFGDTGKFRWDRLGFNFRMPEAMGAIGLAQLDKLEAAVAARHRIASRYTAAFAGEPALLPPRHAAPEATNYQLYTMRLDLDRITVERDEFIDRLAARGVSARLYYPPLHRAGVFADLGDHDDADFPETLRFAASALSLPIYPGLTEDQQERVVRSVLDVAAEVRR